MMHGITLQETCQDPMKLERPSAYVNTSCVREASRLINEPGGRVLYVLLCSIVSAVSSALLTCGRLASI